MLILVAVGHSAVRDDAVWRLRDEVVLLLLGLRGWRGLVAEEAEGPVGEVEAAEDDDCCEDLFDQWVSEASVFVCVVRGEKVEGWGVRAGREEMAVGKCCGRMLLRVPVLLLVHALVGVGVLARMRVQHLVDPHPHSDE